MDTAQLIWIIVIIVVILAVLGRGALLRAEEDARGAP